MIEGLENNSTKPFWRYIKSKRQDSCGIAPLKSLIIYLIEYSKNVL
jgi:predicted double-glycine peptidase